MSPQIPGIRKNPQPQPVQLPVIQIAGANVQYQTAPDGTVMMLVGPVMLALPFTPEGAKDQAEKMRAAASNVIAASPVVLP